MKLTIVAATGGIGRQLLAQSLAAGHDVTAVVRDPARLDAQVRAVAVDLASADASTGPGADALRAAMGGADAVLSGLGARTKADEGVATRGTRALVEAMDAVGTARLVVVSAAPIGTVPSPARPHPPRHDEGDGFMVRHVLAPAVKRALRKHYADLAAMEDELRASRLAWTAVRPPRLTDKPHTGTYRTALGRNLRGGLSISRADVADAMLRSLTLPETERAVLGVAY